MYEAPHPRKHWTSHRSMPLSSRESIFCRISLVGGILYAIAIPGLCKTKRPRRMRGSRNRSARVPRKVPNPLRGVNQVKPVFVLARSGDFFAVSSRLTKRLSHLCSLLQLDCAERLHLLLLLLEQRVDFSEQRWPLLRVLFTRARPRSCAS